MNAWHGGLVYYVGAYLDEAAQQAFIDRVIQTAQLKPVMQAPSGVEVGKRVSAEGEDIFIVINHEREEQVVALPWSAHDHLSEAAVTDELKLAPYGVSILT